MAIKHQPSANIIAIARKVMLARYQNRLILIADCYRLDERLWIAPASRRRMPCTTAVGANISKEVLTAAPGRQPSGQDCAKWRSKIRRTSSTVFGSDCIE